VIPTLQLQVIYGGIILIPCNTLCLLIFSLSLVMTFIDNFCLNRLKLCYKWWFSMTSTFISWHSTVTKNFFFLYIYLFISQFIIIISFYSMNDTPLLSLFIWYSNCLNFGQREPFKADLCVHTINKHFLKALLYLLVQEDVPSLSI
jgi:hypothetical protein